MTRNDKETPLWGDIVTQKDKYNNESNKANNNERSLQ